MHHGFLSSLVLSCCCLVSACDDFGEPADPVEFGVDSSTASQSSPGTLGVAGPADEQAQTSIIPAGQTYGPCDFSDQWAPWWTGCDDPNDACHTPLPVFAVDFLSICLPVQNTRECEPVEFFDPASGLTEFAPTIYDPPHCQILCTPAEDDTPYCPLDMTCSAEGTCAVSTKHPWSPAQAGETWGPCDMTLHGQPGWWGCAGDELGNGDACIQPLANDDDHLTMCVPQRWSLPAQDCPDVAGIAGIAYPLFEDTYCAIECDNDSECPAGAECSAFGACAFPTQMP